MNLIPWTLFVLIVLWYSIESINSLTSPSFFSLCKTKLLSKFKKNKSRRPTIDCIHTELDCENCMKASDCKMKDENLIIPKKE